MNAQEHTKYEYDQYVSDCKVAAIIPLDFKEWVNLRKPKIVKILQNDPVNHPKHYNSHPSGIECIQVTRHFNFNLGNAIKYIWRANHNSPIEDLKKAIWYINDEIKRLESGK